ncbi:hypothetical protein ACWDAO_12390 [Streptomyces sp. NPDC001212]|uniref:hypothetical protein n=1 Tax=Streptomyces sp. HYC2 TaxID=2955207 RepID=UPI0024806FE7|nr:hypothetical protein [Streptomyces sp. HYC2]
MAGAAPKSRVHLGRVVRGGTAHQTQVLTLTDAEVAERATTTATGEDRPGPDTSRGKRGDMAHEPRPRATCLGFTRPDG